MMTACAFASFFVLLIIGVPISVCLAMSSVIAIAAFSNTALLAMLTQKMFASVDQYTMLAVPFFLLAGGFLEKGGVSKRLTDLANSLVGWLPGGLAVVTFLASAFFGAISGSAVATVAAIGAIMVPAMLKDGYPEKFVLATVASAGWLGIIVPPSIPMVLYGVAGNVSVSKMLIGGFIPGFILAGSMSIYSVIYGRNNIRTNHGFSLGNVFVCLKKATWALMMPVIILGGIYCGVFTPTEAAAVACLYAFIVGVFVYKELKLADTLRVFRNAAVTSGMLLFVIAAAAMFGLVLTRGMLPVNAAKFIAGVAESKFAFWALMTVMLLIIGTFMDAAPAIMILTPIFVPLLKSYGIDSISFGVTMIVLLGIGLTTPPVGLNLYVAAGLRKTTIEMVVNRHLLIYIVMAVLTSIVFMMFPRIITILPDYMLT